MLSLLYGPALTSVYDYWKNHSFAYMDLCQQSDVSAFLYVVQVCHSFPSKGQASFSFMTAVTIRSDFGTQENKICHCFQFFPFYLPWSDWMLSFKPAFSLSSRVSLVPLHFLPLEWYLHIWGCWYSTQQTWFQLVLHPARHFTWHKKCHYFLLCIETK